MVSVILLFSLACLLTSLIGNSIGAKFIKRSEPDPEEQVNQEQAQQLIGSIQKAIQQQNQQYLAGQPPTQILQLVKLTSLKKQGPVVRFGGYFYVVCNYDLVSSWIKLTNYS